MRLPHRVSCLSAPSFTHYYIYIYSDGNQQEQCKEQMAEVWDCFDGLVYVRHSKHAKYAGRHEHCCLSGCLDNEETDEKTFQLIVPMYSVSFPYHVDITCFASAKVNNIMQFIKFVN